MNRRLLRMFAFAGCTVVGLPASATAQVPSDGPEPSAATVRVGVLSLAPRFSVGQIGVDTNVFNTVDNPQRDATATASTGTDLWLRTGRGLLMVSGDIEYVHYDRFASERAVSSSAYATYEVRFNRIRPVVRGAMRDVKQQPNDEITARVRQYSTDFRAGIECRVMSSSTMRVEWRQEVSGFSDTAVFDGQQLNTQLNHRVAAVDATWRQQLTPLTTFVAKVSRDRTTFDFEGNRNSENYRLNSGFELSQFALIRGALLVGYHELRADNPVVLPEFSGVTAEGDVSYTAPTRTRIQVNVTRELRNSYDPRTPHYTQQAWGVTVTQRVFGQWDLQLNGGRAEQDYLAVAGTGARTDRVDRIGVGIGLALAGQVRAGLDITSVNRLSEMPGLDYRGVRGGLSVTYGY